MRRLLIIFLLLYCHVVLAENFNYYKIIFGKSPTISLRYKSIDLINGAVEITGYDSRTAPGPYTWDWGDGYITQGSFPQEHIYRKLNTNYVVRVIANYSNVESDTAQLFVRFTKTNINHINLPNDILVSIPNKVPEMSSRMPAIDSIININYEQRYKNLTFLDESFFNLIDRSQIEYVLSVAALIQKSFANNDLFQINSAFNQIVLRDSTIPGGMYSVWYTNPVSFASSNSGFQRTIEWSSFFHEMGHNTTLNFPASYYFGGKIDGNANAIFSETMAQIFAHATGYELINNYKKFGISEDLKSEIQCSILNSCKIIRRFFYENKKSGFNFTSWNNPSTTQDETINTFMTIAFKFLEHAEINNEGYLKPVQNMMHFLGKFNPTWATKFSRLKNSKEAEVFRATMMICALSAAFKKDLRDEFRDLKFPISDAVYKELLKNNNF
jgi:hypothetical protein